MTTTKELIAQRDALQAEIDGPARAADERRAELARIDAELAAEEVRKGEAPARMVGNHKAYASRLRRIEDGMAKRAAIVESLRAEEEAINADVRRACEFRDGMRDDHVDYGEPLPEGLAPIPVPGLLVDAMIVSRLLKTLPRPAPSPKERERETARQAAEEAACAAETRDGLAGLQGYGRAIEQIKALPRDQRVGSL